MPALIVTKTLRAAMVAVLALPVAAVASGALVFGSAALAPAAAEPTPVDINNLDMVPVVIDGVTGINPQLTQTPTMENLVWDMQQAGQRLFVGGAFLNVQKGKSTAPVAQPYLAAFDVNTGDWVQECRPTFDRAVYTLEVNSQGKLLVGGEFEKVNGQARKALVALDPTTCQIDSSFPGSVDRPWSSYRAQVRDMRVVGDSLYLAGNFSHVLGANNSRIRAYKAAKMNPVDATIDKAFLPEVTGSGVWGLGVDPGRSRVYLTGYFSGVNGTTNSGYFHTVDANTGASVGGLQQLPRNFPRGELEMFDVEVGNNKVFIAGEQHIMQVLNSDDNAMTAFSSTGYKPNTFEYSGAFAGGAYQFAERIGDVIFAGCHCTYAIRNGLINHYNSVLNKRTPNKLTMAYDVNDGKIFEDFRPDLDGSKDGSWAATSDTNKCLYLGGDYKVGGVAAGKARWVGGFAKFCPKGWMPPQPDTQAPTVPQKVEAANSGDGTANVSWLPAIDDVEVAGYHVLRDGQRVADVAGARFADKGLKLGTKYTYTVQAFDKAGNNSSTSGPAEVTVTASTATPDTVAPTWPESVKATGNTGGGVTVTWSTATDNVKVKNYLIYRDGTYIGWTPETSFVDAKFAGTSASYTVRTIDTANNRSLHSDPASYP